MAPRALATTASLPAPLDWDAVDALGANAPEILRALGLGRELAAHLRGLATLDRGTTEALCLLCALLERLKRGFASDPELLPRVAALDARGQGLIFKWLVRHLDELGGRLAELEASLGSPAPAPGPLATCLDQVVAALSALVAGMQAALLVAHADDEGLEVPA